MIHKGYKLKGPEAELTPELVLLVLDRTVYVQVNQ